MTKNALLQNGGKQNLSINETCTNNQGIFTLKKWPWTKLASAKIWFGLCCLMTSGLSKDIRCHV